MPLRSLEWAVWEWGGESLRARGCRDRRQGLKTEPVGPGGFSITRLGLAKACAGQLEMR